jgi:DNA-binding NarL/FixJ family response regulator
MSGRAPRGYDRPITDEIDVFLCDDVRELRALLRYGLEEDAGLRVVGEAGDAETAISEVGARPPDVILLDLSMPGLDGLEAIPRIREVAPDTKIVVLSGFASERMRGPALAAGADRYVEKGVALDELRAAVRETALGRAA